LDYGVLSNCAKLNLKIVLFGKELLHGKTTMNLRSQILRSKFLGKLLKTQVLIIGAK
jgi:hypothetical protein